MTNGEEAAKWAITYMDLYEEYKRLIAEGKMAGEYRPDWLWNKGVNEITLFLKWVFIVKNEKEKVKKILN